MSALVLAFCAHEDRQAVARSVLTPDPPMLLWHDAAGVDVAAQHRPLILLAIDAHGGAALARWVEGHGLDGVMGIGLVGVTAPIIMPTCCKFHATGGHPADRHGLIDEAARVYGSATERYTNLGPLEPLRAVAERARAGVTAGTFSHTIHFAEIDGPVIGSTVKADHAYPLRLVIACAPGDGVCGVCLGERRVVGAQSRVGPSQDPLPKPCPGCSGTGKALSSADVALELSGGRALYDGIDDFQATTGGLTVIHYPKRDVVAEHGLAAVLKAIGP